LDFREGLEQTFPTNRVPFLILALWGAKRPRGGLFYLLLKLARLILTLVRKKAKIRKPKFSSTQKIKEGELGGRIFFNPGFKNLNFRDLTKFPN